MSLSIALVIFIHFELETPILLFLLSKEVIEQTIVLKLKLCLDYLPRGNDPNLTSWVIYLTRPLYFSNEK